jgi:hypothetical protein
MTRWQTLYLVVKDLALTGTGVAVILSQVASAHPSDLLLGAGLALTVPSVAGHAGALLTGRDIGSSSPSPPPRQPRPPSVSSEAAGERTLP